MPPVNIKSSKNTFDNRKMGREKILEAFKKAQEKKKMIETTRAEEWSNLQNRLEILNQRGIF